MLVTGKSFRVFVAITAVANLKFATVAAFDAIDILHIINILHVINQMKEHELTKIKNPVDVRI